MERLRSAQAAAELIREKDPNSTLTAYTIRNLMESGKLPYIEVGHKRFTSMEAIESSDF